MSTVDQDGELNPPGPTEVIQSVHRRANGAPTKQDVIDQNDRFIGDIEGDDCWMNIRCDMFGQVVTIHPDVEAPDGDRLTPDAVEELSQSFCQYDTPTLNADKHHFAALFIALGNFVRHAGQGALQGDTI